MAPRYTNDTSPFAAHHSLRYKKKEAPADCTCCDADDVSGTVMSRHRGAMRRFLRQWKPQLSIVANVCTVKFKLLWTMYASTISWVLPLIEFYH